MQTFVLIWRSLVLLLLAAIVGELMIANREFRAVRSGMPQASEVGEKLDQIHTDLDGLWSLTNEMVK